MPEGAIRFDTHSNGSPTVKKQRHAAVTYTLRCAAASRSIVGVLFVNGVLYVSDSEAHRIRVLR
jgi:hypothetical protein